MNLSVASQVTATLQQSGSWRLGTVILSHEGHVPDPRDSRFFPVYRGLTQGEHRQLIEISEATPLERQQLTKLLSHRLQRFVDAKDVSNARSKSSKSSIEGLSETAKLLNSLSSGDGWEVDITFHGSPNGEIPAAYYIFQLGREIEGILWRLTYWRNIQGSTYFISFEITSQIQNIMIL